MIKSSLFMAGRVIWMTCALPFVLLALAFCLVVLLAAMLPLLYMNFVENDKGASQ